MPVDPNVLLGAKGIDVPGPMQLAGQGLTLAELFGKTQMQQLQLRQANAEMNYWTQALGGDQSGGGAPDAQGGAASNPFGLNMDALRKNPEAARSVIPAMLGMQEKQSVIGKNLQEVAKSKIDTLNMQLGQIGSMAAGMADNPTLTDAQHLASRIYEIDPKLMGMLDTSGDHSAFVKSARDRFTPEKTRAETAKALVETQLAGPKLAVEQQRAATAAQELALQQAKFTGGEPFQDPDTKEWFVRSPKPGGGWAVTPASGAGAPAAPQAMPGAPVEAPPPAGGWQPGQPLPAAPPGSTQRTSPDGIAYMAPPGQPAAAPGVPTGAAGGPVTGPGFAAKELGVANAKTAGAMEAQIPGAVEGLNAIYNQRQLIARKEGIYSGPIKGSDFFKNIAGIMSQLPGASPDMVAKVSNTQAWDAQGGELAFDFLQANKGSVPRAQQALNMIRTIKPNTIMTSQAQQDVMNFMEEVFRDRINYAKSVAGGVRGGKTLSDVPMPLRSSGAGEIKMNKDGSWTLNP